MFVLNHPLLKTSIIFLVAALFCGCKSGIHLKVQNPKKPGKYPKMDRAQIMLARKTINRSCFDVKYYQLKIKIDPVQKSVSGTVVINALAVSNIDSIQIDLYKNLKLNSVQQNNINLPYKRTEGAILIKMPGNIKAGENFSLALSYEGKPIVARKPPWSGGAVWKLDEDKNFWSGIACESEGASLWWPNKDDVSDEADSSDIILTGPKNLSLVSNGVLKRAEINKDSTQTFHWHVSYPINNYNITFYLGNFKLITDTFISKATGKNIFLSYYVLPRHIDVAKPHFQQLKQHLEFYEKIYGPYPWPNDGYKLVEAPYEGMEHQTAIAYGSGFKNDADGFDYIILHETAHEWWGNSVTAADLSDVWLQEGFATFSEALYVESTKGREAYLDYLFYYRITILNKLPVVRERNRRYFSSNDEDVYSKGAWVLHTLRTVINNDSLFFDIIKTFRIENHQKQIFSETFIDFVNKKTGSNYNWFFNQYLYNRQVPMLESCWFGDDFYYRWENTAPDFNKLPIVVKCGQQTETLYPNNKIQKITIKYDPKLKLEFIDDGIYFGDMDNKHLPGIFEAGN